MKRTSLAVTLVLAAAVLATDGCKTQGGPTPALAPTFYSQAATAMDGFSTVLVQAQSIFSTAFQEQMLAPDDYQRGQQVFGQIAVSADAVVTALQAGQPEASIQAQINALITQAAAMPQAFAIKNPQSQAAFTSVINSLVALLKNVEAQLPATAATKHAATAAK